MKFAMLNNFPLLGCTNIIGVSLGSLILLFVAGCMSSSPETLSVKDIFDPNWKTDTCNVHSEKLIEAVEPLIMAKVCAEGKYYEARAKFPYAMTDMHTDGPEYYWRVRYCPTCREGLAAWEEKRNQEP